MHLDGLQCTLNYARRHDRDVAYTCAVAVGVGKRTGEERERIAVEAVPDCSYFLYLNSQQRRRDRIANTQDETSHLSHG